MTSPAATILIVDDEIQNRKLLELLLQFEGYLTLSAANGEEALASIAQRAPDLILLDVMMPGMDGYQMAKLLKANPATANIPIIMVTAQIERSARLAGLDAGAEEFLTKPVERAELLLRVRNLLRLKEFSDFLQNHSVILEQQVQARTADLRASESKFRQLADNIRDAFFLLNADGTRMLYISPAYEEIWGRSCESLYANSESWTESIHPDDRAATDENYRKALSAGKAEFEFRIVRQDGSIRWIEVRAFPVRDDDGMLVRLAGVAEDTTERKQAEEEIRRLSKFPAENPNPVLRIGRSGIILYANESSAPILATWGRDVGQNVPDYCQKWIVANFESGASEEVEIKCNKRFFSLILAPILAEEYVNIYGCDITERKQAERELHESERRFSDMLRNVELVSVMRDREGRITYCNEYMLRLTGWQYEEVIGRNWIELFIPPEIGDEKKDVFAALLANMPEAWHHENEILTRSGKRRLIHWSNSVLRSGAGDVIGTASIGEDITERKMAEEVLKQRAAELERFHRLSVGRELQMIELKKQINERAKQAGQTPPYDLAFLDPEPVKTKPVNEKTS